MEGNCIRGQGSWWAVVPERGGEGEKEEIYVHWNCGYPISEEQQGRRIIYTDDTYMGTSKRISSCAK